MQKKNTNVEQNTQYAGTDPRSTDVSFDLCQRVDLRQHVDVYVMRQQLPETLPATQSQHNRSYTRLHQKKTPSFITVCLELAATNSSHQRLSVCF